MTSRLFRIPMLCCLLFAGLTGCRTGSNEQDPEPTGPQPPDFPPYAGEPLRLPPRRGQVVDFERLAQVTASSGTGDAFLLKNTDQAIWGSSAGELRFTPAGAGPHRVRLEPEQPWTVLSLFDHITLWARDEAPEAGLRDDRAVRLMIRDGKGFLREWVMPYSPKPGWQMLHLRVPESVPVPVQIESIDWMLPEGVTRPQRILLEALTLYQEVLSRIPQRINYVRPEGYAPAFAPVRENSVTLDFPTGPAAFRPATREVRHMETLERLNAESFTATYRTESEELVYRIRAEDGAPVVDLKSGADSWRPLWTGLGLEGPDVEVTLRFARIRDRELFLQYTGGISFTFSLHGKTLQVDVESLRENLAALNLGELSGIRELPVPFLRVGFGKPLPVKVMKGEEFPLRFASLIPDWWMSMSSRYEPSPDPDGAGRMVYEPRWRGSRNIFRERLYLSVSNRLQEVLPSPAAPRALFYGQVENLLWSDPPADLVLKDRILDMAPSDPDWDDAMLARTPEGEWLTYPVGHAVVMKTARMQDLAVERIVQTRAAHGEKVLYFPAGTRWGPWRFTDHDNRVVGAGTYAQAYAEIGAFFQQAEAEWGGPLIGAGGAEWLWAGLVSAFVPDFPLGLEQLHPFLPHIAWRNLNPVSRLLGVGPLESFRLPGESEAEDRSRWIDRSLAFQVAYGAPGRLPAAPEGAASATCERLLGVLQRLFAGRTADRISYWDGTAFVDASEAMRSGALADSRLYVRLDDQTEIWVNGHFTEPWTIRVEARETALPPFGFVVRAKDSRVEHHPGNGDGAGLCVIKEPGQTWVCSQDTVRSAAGVTIRGCLGLSPAGEGGCRIELPEWHGEARISEEVFPLAKVGTIQAVDRNGKPVSTVSCTLENGEWVLRSDADLQSVMLYETIRGGDRNFLP